MTGVIELTKLWTLPVLALGLVLAVVACRGDENEDLSADLAPSSSSTVTPSSTHSTITSTSPPEPSADASSPTPSSVVEEMKTFSDDQYGYSLSYPSSWFLLPPNTGSDPDFGSGLSITSYDPKQGPPPGGEGFRLDVIGPKLNPNELSASQWLSETSDHCGSVVLLTQPQTLGPLQGTRQDVQVPPGKTQDCPANAITYTSIVAESGDRLVAITTYPAETYSTARLREIVDSVRIQP
jgi:hypothetical protein